MRANYTVEIYTPQDLNHSSYIQTGLFELEQLGLINCKLKVDLSKKLGRITTEFGSSIKSSHPHQKTSFYKLKDHLTGKVYFFATDLSDIPYSFSQYALENCDFIFKRNYVSGHVGCLESKFQDKIFPMGLTLGTQSSHRRFWTVFKVAHVVSNLNLVIKIDRLFFTRIKRVIMAGPRHRKYVTKGRSLELLENTSQSKHLNIFYQVRCFSQIKENHVKKINDHRGYLIRILKKILGPDFKGGMVPGEVSNKYYNDCLTNLPTDPESYLDLIKNSTICIYTNGLRGSPARKLLEYLSQGKCIVAERFDAELPILLEHGKNIMFFDTPEQCARICNELLNDPDKVKSLSENARAYFENHVHPVQNVKRILELMLNKSLD